MSMKTVSQLHQAGYSDYAQAVKDIHQALGDISQEHIWGRQVLCAVYVRPNSTEKRDANGQPVKDPEGKPVVIWHTTSAQEEDVWQGKALLVLAMGPDAFQGDESYLKATFPDGKPPKVGDWLFARPNDGIAMSVLGAGASRPQGVDHMGRALDKFEWDGWPCRILQDTSFFGKMSVPHAIV